jgi:hypothetical protein
VEKKAMQNLEFIEKGVAISPAVPVVGDKVTILYDGILSKNGAKDVSVHLGYGDHWDNEQDVPMVKGRTCFETTVPALKEEFLNISFRDPTNNTDDNSGKGYSFEITG